MYSPSSSAELSAYILDYKAQKSLRNSPLSTPTRNLHHGDNMFSRSWLHEVLTMPAEYRDRSKSDTASSSKEPSINEWLKNIDEKISKRFPKVSGPFSSVNNSSDNGDETICSDTTLDLITADTKTGFLYPGHCASYDSHPNALQSFKLHQDENAGADENYCECSDLKAPAWVEDVINENVCSACLENVNDPTCYHPPNKEYSVDLPDGYKLFESKTKGKSGKPHKLLDSKKKNSRTAADKSPNLNETPNPQRVSPETENIMKLLERAINQLQDVKGAVEENTVSAITSDVSTTSQALSDLPVD